MTDIAQLNQGRFYWILVRATTKGPEWQPARFTGLAGHSAGAKWDFIGFNSDVGHHFVEVVEIGPELTDGAVQGRTLAEAAYFNTGRASNSTMSGSGDGSLC